MYVCVAAEDRLTHDTRHTARSMEDKQHEAQGEMNLNHDEIKARSVGRTVRMRKAWNSGDVQETSLLPNSIGDSQPRDRLPAGSLHRATTGEKRRAELRDTTGGGKGKYENSG